MGNEALGHPLKETSPDPSRKKRPWQNVHEVGLQIGDFLVGWKGELGLPMKMKLLKHLCLTVLVVFTAALLSGCTTVPVTGRPQLNLISPGQEMQLGLTSFNELKKQTPVSRDAAATALVQKVGQRIAAVAGPDMPDAPWEFVLFDSKEVNAFCLPGGKVGVYTGILQITTDEAGMATVLGHEIAHAVARHGGERMTTAMVLQGVGSLAAAGLSKTDPRWQSGLMLAYGAGSQLGELKFSRDHESEADQIGLRYMARAGYNPEAAVQFWHRFAAFNAQQGGATPEFLRTHPSDETRIQRLQQWMPAAKAEFKPAQ